MLSRLFRHATASLSVRQKFPKAVLGTIERAVTEQEHRHVGELRFAVEGGLDFEALYARQDARARAVDLFGRLGVWDTEHNSGVLIYVLLGDRAVEIVADRGILAKVAQPQWDAICRAMEKAFAAGDYEAGALEGVRRIGELLVRHFPAGDSENPNELPDEPLVL